MLDSLIDLIHDSELSLDSVKLAVHILADGWIKVPCRVGDKVYKIWSCGKHGKSIAEFEITHIDIDNYPNIEIAFRKPNSKATYAYYFAKQSDFGKTIFFSKKEVLEKLKELNKNA